MPRHNFVIIFIFILVATACRQPVKTSDFRELHVFRGWESSVVFTIEMTDTVHWQEMSVCAQFSNEKNIHSFEKIPIVIHLVSPAGNQYADTVSFPLHVIPDNHFYTNENGLISIQWPYRKNIRNKEPGSWTITLIPNGKTGENSIYQNIIGLGISCKKEEKQHEQ